MYLKKEIYEECPICNGSGIHFKKECSWCRGKGRWKELKAIIQKYIVKCEKCGELFELNLFELPFMYRNSCPKCHIVGYCLLVHSPEKLGYNSVLIMDKIPMPIPII